MKLQFLLLITTSLTAALPGRYHQQYQFQRSSASFQNNELQHKKDEAGSYLKQGDTNNDTSPQEQTSYLQQEYQKPEADDIIKIDHTPSDDLAETIRKQNAHNEAWLREVNKRLQESRNQRSYSNSPRYEASSTQTSYSHSNTRHWNRPHTSEKPQANGKLEELDDHSIDYSRYQAHGFGKEYLDNTEGHNQRRPTSQVGTNTIYQSGRGTNYGGQSRDLVTSSLTHNKHDSDQFDGQKEEDLTQQTQDVFGADLTQSQEDLSQKTEDGFANLEFGSQHKENDGKLIHESQKEDAFTQQKEDGFGQTNFGKLDYEFNSQTHGSVGKIESDSHKLIHQEQFDNQKQEGKIQQQNERQWHLNTEYKEKNNENLEMTQQKQDRWEDLTRQPQDELGNPENGRQPSRKIESIQHTTQRGNTNLHMSGQTQNWNQFKPQIHQNQYGRPSGRDNFENERDLTQQSQVSFGKPEFVSQHNQQESQFGRHLEDQDDMTQQSEVGFGKLHIGSHQQGTQYGKNFDLEDKTEQSLMPLGKLEIGNHQHRTQSGQNFEHEDMTQQTQVGFGKLEIGPQHNPWDVKFEKDFEDQEDLTQQSQIGFGKLEMGTHQHGTQSKHYDQEDMTQQTQVGFGKLETGNYEHRTQTEKHFNREDMTQQSQVGFGKLETGNYEHGIHSEKNINQEHMTQQSQVGFGKLETENYEHGIQSGTHFNQDDMTQQSQVTFDKLKSGNHPEGTVFEKHIDRDDMTQQTQVGFGRLELGSHQQGNQSRNFDQEHLTQQSQTGFEKFDYGENEDLTQKTENEFGKLEFDTTKQKENTEDRIRSQTGYDNRDYSGSQLYGSSYGGQRQISSSHNHQSAYSYHSAPKPVYEEVHEETDDDMKAIEDIAQFAQKVQDVSQQAHKRNFPQEMEKIEDSEYNKDGTNIEHHQIKIEELSHADVEVPTTKKPGFWKRLGSSITSSFETAKEKTIHLADKVKHNLG